jgi:hypothetical protein
MCYLGDSEQQLNDQLSRLAQQLHGLAASLAQARQGYQMNGDQRYVAQVKQVLPYYETTLKQYGEVSRKLGKMAMPPEFMKTLSDFSEWASSKVIKPAVEGAAQTIQALPRLVPWVAGTAVAFFLWQSGVLKNVARKATGRSSPRR